MLPCVEAGVGEKTLASLGLLWVEGARTPLACSQPVAGAGGGWAGHSVGPTIARDFRIAPLDCPIHHPHTPHTPGLPSQPGPGALASRFCPLPTRARCRTAPWTWSPKHPTLGRGFWLNTAHPSPPSSL